MAPRTAPASNEPNVADLEAQLAAAKKQGDEYRSWFEEHQALLEYACNLVAGKTALNRDIVPVDDVTERREVAVAYPDSFGRWRLASYGVDSDVAKLFDHLRVMADLHPDLDTTTT